MNNVSLFNATLKGMTLRGAIEGANALFEGINVNNGTIRLVGNASIIGNANINGTGGLTVNTGFTNMIPSGANASLTLGPSQSLEVTGQNVFAFVNNSSFASQGPITVNAGSFGVQGTPSAFAATGPLNVINGGLVNINSQTATLGGMITVDSTSTLTVQNVDTTLNTQVLAGGGAVKFIGRSLTFNQPQFSNGVRFSVSDLDADFATPVTITGVAGGQPITLSNVTATGQSATFDLPVDFSGGHTTLRMPTEFRGGVRVISSLELDNKSVSVQPVHVIGPSASLTIGDDTGGSNFGVDPQEQATLSLVTRGNQTMTVNVGGNGNMNISYGAGDSEVIGNINLPQNTVTFRRDPFSPVGASTVTFGKITVLNLEAFGQFGSPSTLKVN